MGDSEDESPSSVEPASLSKIQRLQIASQVAPILRSHTKEVHTRPVHLIDKDGKVTGVTTRGEVVRSVFERAKIEFDIVPVPGKRPERVICEGCGKPIKVARTGRQVRFCTSCKTEKCATCNKAMPKGSSAPARIAKRKKLGIRPECMECKRKKVEVVLCGDCQNPLSPKAAREHRFKASKDKERKPRCRSCYLKAKSDPTSKAGAKRERKKARERLKANG